MPRWTLPQPLQTTLGFFQTFVLPTAENNSIVSGIQPVISAPNHLWQQCFTDDNLDTAKDWLQKQSREQDHSDTRDYVRHWVVNKTNLQQRLEDNRFCFQTVREIEITDEQGRISRREIRYAEDRLLIRAIAQVLKPVFGQALYKDCMHLSGNGGGKTAVAQTQDYISQHPDHQVIKSDVKRYYASIDHVILHEQLNQLLPNEKTLNRLLWNFMRRTVEFGGNYREVETGLPLGASLSPLFSALYLSPLDELAKNTPNTFYRRYMDDWVWVFPKKQTLRTTMKKQYGILHALRVAMHPDKTFIGKVKKGFDFLGFHLTPTGVTVSDGALSRHEDKVARLYEQDAKPKRIRAYRLRWLVWGSLGVTLFVGSLTPAFATCTSLHPDLLPGANIGHFRYFYGSNAKGNAFLTTAPTTQNTYAGRGTAICAADRAPLIRGLPLYVWNWASSSYCLVSTNASGSVLTAEFVAMSTGTATPISQLCVYPDNTGPTFTSGLTAGFHENGTGTVYTAIATDATPTVTFALTGGADQALFSLSTGVLTFNASPDFESPGDDGGDNVYNIEITASDGVTPTANTTVQAVAVTVTNDTNDDHATTASLTDANGQTLTNGSSTVFCTDAPVGGSGTCDVTMTGTFADGPSTEVDIGFEPSPEVSNTLYDRLRQFSLWNLIGISDAVAVGPDDFTVLTANPFTIDNGSTETFTFTFTPTQVGASDGVVVLTFSDGSEFRFTISGNGTVATPVNSGGAQNIPIFGPFGLLAMLMGLLWFGNRRRNG